MSTVTFPLAQTSKKALLFVTFSYGSGPTYVRYTDWDSDVVHPTSGATFTSVAAMDVKLPKYTGVFKEGSLGIALPANVFTLLLSSGIPFPEVSVTVEELTQDVDETVGRLLTLFKGIVLRTIQNYQGNPNVVQIEVENIKAQFGVKLGLVATHHCNWGLGSLKGCDPAGTAISLASLVESGTLTTISGSSVIITGLSAVRDRYWHRGYVEYEWLRITIRDWLSGTTFQLTKRPPSTWSGKTVSVTPGCDKTKETCALWNNETHFGGAGLGMPSYHPSIETP